MVENPFEKRARRKMVQDPVTGATNVNPKLGKSKKKEVNKTISRPDKFIDLRPLDNFQSNLLGTKRLSVFSTYNMLT
jgi:hypothetical protein